MRIDKDANAMTYLKFVVTVDVLWTAVIYTFAQYANAYNNTYCIICYNNY